MRFVPALLPVFRSRRAALCAWPLALGLTFAPGVRADDLPPAPPLARMPVIPNPAPLAAPGRPASGTAAPSVHAARTPRATPPRHARAATPGASARPRRAPAPAQGASTARSGG